MPRPESEPKPIRERMLHNLRPEVSRTLLPLAKRLTGQALVIKRAEILPNDANAHLVPPQEPGKPWEVHFARGQERFLDHVLAHEIGHIVRLFKAAPSLRLQPAVSAEARSRAVHQLAPELGRLLAGGFPEELLAESFDGWYGGLMSQLVSAPADLRIEEWIHKNYPGLRSVQERALVHEVERSFPLLEPAQRLLTPPTIYRAKMTMNAAQAIHVANLFRRFDLLKPFEQERGFLQRGAMLTAQVLAVPDEGHLSDMVAVNQWALEFGLTGWFEWVPYQETQ